MRSIPLDFWVVIISIFRPREDYGGWHCRTAVKKPWGSARCPKLFREQRLSRRVLIFFAPFPARTREACFFFMQRACLQSPQNLLPNSSFAFLVPLGGVWPSKIFFEASFGSTASTYVHHCPSSTVLASACSFEKLHVQLQRGFLLVKALGLPHSQSTLLNPRLANFLLYLFFLKKKNWVCDLLVAERHSLNLKVREFDPIRQRSQESRD